MSKLKFWGVQGSCPGSISNNTFGNNTPCISIELQKTLIILDAGTGIRHLSNELKSDHYEKVLVLLTHSHWDHIQGFPFFNFLHTESEIYIYSHSNSHLKNLSNQINGVNFPLNLQDITASLTFSSNLESIQSIFNLTIQQIKTNHHGDCIGYRITSGSCDVCYLPDNQLHNTTKTSVKKFTEFCKDTNYLIHDAQYTNKDMPKKVNWGHSIIQDAHNLSCESDANHLVLFHHDPDRNKDEINKIVSKLNKNNQKPFVIASYEGLELDLLGKYTQ